MRKKSILIALFLFVAAMSFVSAAGSQEAEAGCEDGINLLLSCSGRCGPLTALIDKICADFMAENPNITIKPVYTGNYDDTVVKIQTAIQGKNPPDFFINLATQTFFDGEFANCRSSR